MNMKYLIPILLLLMVTPAMAANITHFNAATADSHDQVDTVRLALNSKGNVTIAYTTDYVLDSINTSLVIDFSEANITAYSYTATGDTANLTVTRNPTNLTFTYAPYTTVTITQVNLTFDFDKGLTTTQGIDTDTAMTSIKALTYVSFFNTTRTTENTTEKINYIVYDPLKVYTLDKLNLTSPENATLEMQNGVYYFNLTNATTNEGKLKLTFKRGDYHEGLVPVHRGILSVHLNDTYITSPITVSAINCTEVGAVEYDGYTKLKYLDTEANETKVITISVSLWNTSTKLSSGIVLNYSIDPDGGLTATADDAKDINITAAAVLVPVLPYWWQTIIFYKIAGFPLIGWLGIIVATTIFVIMVWRATKGMPVLPRRASARASILLIWLYITLLSTLQNWWKQVFTWVANNPVPASIVIVVIFALLWLAMVQLTTRD